MGRFARLFCNEMGLKDERESQLIIYLLSELIFDSDTEIMAPVSPDAAPSCWSFGYHLNGGHGHRRMTVMTAVRPVEYG